jgi:ABC-2 type transport system ATP-binding protein
VVHVDDVPDVAQPVEPAVVVRGLTKRYRSGAAVGPLTFDARPGRITGLDGPDGSGRSTALAMIVGLVRPSEGEALVNGLPYGALPEPLAYVGAVVGPPGLNPGWTGRNHLWTVAPLAEADGERVDEVLAEVGLQAEADRPTRTYTSGMRQRLRLARALLGDPEILILDEPAAGLDPEGVGWLCGLLRARAAGGGTVVVAGPWPSAVEAVVDDLVPMPVPAAEQQERTA